MAGFIRLGTVAEVPEGDLRAYDVNGTHVCVGHLAERMFALGDECPEDGCSLAEGILDDDGEVVCPCDGSRFDVGSGEPVGGPAVDPVRTFPLRVVEGWLEVLVP